MESHIAEYAAVASAIIAGLALLLSLVAIILGEKRNARQKKFIETQHALNRRLLEREEQASQSSLRSDMGASLFKLGHSKYRVKVWNKGEAIARNVDVIIPEGTDLLTAREVARKFPMETMEKFQSVELVAFVSMSSAVKQPIEIRWDDDTQQGNSKIVYLTT